MEKSFNPRIPGQTFSKFTPPTNINYKYLNKVNLPERKIDENLVAKLFLLVDEGNISKIKDFILQNSFLLNVKNDINKENVLHTVIKSENISNEDKTDLVKFFLFKGVSASSFDKFNVTPIHLAVKNQLKDVVELLIKYGADPNSLDSNNMNTLHYAVIGKNIKCPVKIEETKFIIPKKGIIKNKEQLILQDLFNNINYLYFADITSQNIFKNIYNNINNYDNLYDNIINEKKIELYETVGKILKQEDTSIEKKTELIKDELDKISDDLKGSFMKELDNNVIDFTKKFNYDISNNKILFNDDLLDLRKLVNDMNKNLSKSLKEIDIVVNELINSVKNTTEKVSNIKNELVNIKWLNATLRINYVWDNQSNTNDIIFDPLTLQNIPYYLKTYDTGVPVYDPSIPVVESKIDSICELINNKEQLEDYNLIHFDKHEIDLTTQYIDFDLDIDTKYSNTASEYKRITVEKEKIFNNENKNLTIKKNILGYDIDNKYATSTTQLINGQYTFSFPYTFKVDNADSYILSNEVKRTFLKRVYALSKLLNEQIEIIKTNFGVIIKYIEYSEGWNIMIHIVPSIVICIFNSMRLLKAINDELEIINPKIKQIEQLFIDKQIEIKPKDIPHFWIYEKALDAIKICEKESEQIKNNTNSQYKVLLTIIEKYNGIIDKIQDLQGFIHIMEYHSNYDINNINNVTNTDNNFLNPNYTLHRRIFSNKFDNFKLNFTKYQQLDLVDNSRDFFNIYLDNLFNNNINIFYDDLQGQQFYVNTYLKNKYNYKYPNTGIISNNDVFPTVQYRNFMNFPNYINDPSNIYHKPLYQFKNNNIIKGAVTLLSSSQSKSNANNNTIKNIIGNHFILQKFSLLHYISNIFTPNTRIYKKYRKNIKAINGGELYKNINNNLNEYKNEYKKKMKITDEDFQYTHYKLLVDVLIETFNNYVEFLIKQKSKQIAYDLFKSYKIKDIDNNININTIDHYPLIKNDEQFKNLGISTKLTIDEIQNIKAEDYYNFIDNDLINESKLIEYYKTDDNTCFQINKDIIETLINNKANLSQKDNSGRIPIIYALEFKNLNLIDILSKTDNLNNHIGIKFYKNNQDVINYFNILLKNTINELVSKGTYDEFYKKYEKKLIKKLESKTEINTNILSSIQYTIPMYLSLLNSLLFNVLLNYKYKYTQAELDKILKKLFGPINKNLYYGPILHKIDSEINLKDQSKIISKKSLDKEIKKIKDKIALEKLAKSESEKEIINTSMQNNLYEYVRNKQLNSIITDLSNSIVDSEAKKKLLNNIKITENLKPKLNYRKINFTQETIKNVPSMYNNIFKNILNNNISSRGYTSYIEVKRYRTLWKNYISDKHSDYISNIHLVSMNFIDNNITQDSLDIFINLFEVFNQVSRDYSESPFEFNITNYHLNESVKLIIHTLTHTVINYLYFTITKMIIKQLEESYNDKMYISKKKYQEYIINLLQQFLDNKNNNSELITYLFEDMPEKLVKCTLNIYDTEADPDYKKPIDSIFSEIIKIIKSNSTNIINTGDDSELIKNLTTYVIPYYKEYSTIIINELFDLTNKFFKHLEGMYNLLKIHKNLN